MKEFVEWLITQGFTKNSFAPSERGQHYYNRTTDEFISSVDVYVQENINNSYSRIIIETLHTSKGGREESKSIYTTNPGWIARAKFRVLDFF